MEKKANENFIKYCEETKALLLEQEKALAREEPGPDDPPHRSDTLLQCRQALRHFAGLVDSAQRVMAYLPDWIAFSNLAQLFHSYRIPCATGKGLPPNGEAVQAISRFQLILAGSAANQHVPSIMALSLKNGFSFIKHSELSQEWKARWGN